MYMKKHVNVCLALFGISIHTILDERKLSLDPDCILNRHYYLPLWEKKKKAFNLCFIVIAFGESLYVRCDCDVTCHTDNIHISSQASLQY